MLNGRDNYDLIVWANTVPWIGEAEPKSPCWAGYAQEREELARFLVTNEVRNLCMISGDAHMLAIDDGSHAGYAEDGRGGFPIFHAAPLEGMPSVKGGTYSHGDPKGGQGDGIPGTGQYGVFEVWYKDGDNPPHVYWQGKRVEKGETLPQTLVQYDFPAHKTYTGF